MTKWLYRSKYVSFSRLSESLNTCGEDGWELVCAALHSNDRYTLIFKKPVTDKISDEKESTDVKQAD